MALAVRVFARMARTIRGERVARAADVPAGERVVAVVPVLDEEARLEPCLAGLHAQGPELAAVLVVDGGSRDGTLALARAWAAQDDRVRVVDAGPAPAGTNGKVHNLARGLAESAAFPDAGWLLTIDADVRPAPGLVAALLAHARGRGLAALSAATQQRLSGPAEALVHPSLLATLVYRCGVPGHATTDPARVQANGQCMLQRRDVLERAGGFAPLAGEIAEDVALARWIAAQGEPVGFFETDGLVSAEMYAGAREALVNWSRSLPMVEGQPIWRTALGLAEVVLVQAGPLLVVALLAGRRSVPRRFESRSRIEGGARRHHRDGCWRRGAGPGAPRVGAAGAMMAVANMIRMPGRGFRRAGAMHRAGTSRRKSPLVPARLWELPKHGGYAPCSAPPQLRLRSPGIHPRASPRGIRINWENFIITPARQSRESPCPRYLGIRHRRALPTIPQHSMPTPAPGSRPMRVRDRPSNSLAEAGSTGERASGVFGPRVISHDAPRRAASTAADPMTWLARLNVALLAARMGTLVGMARAYPDRPLTYWLSPASDGVAAAAVLLRAFRRRHVWRGRTVVRGGGRAR